MAFLAKTYHDYGMARDTDVAVGKDTLAYENFNIRITARDRETLLSVTNDRGNVRVMPERRLVLWNDPEGKDRTQGFSIVSAADYNKEHEEDSGFVPQDTELHLMGTVIGYNVLNNYVTLFTTEGVGRDHIYRVEYVPGGEPSEWRGLELLSGDCGFDAGMPIETLGDYENDDVLKVYWLDGVNQPRVLNISDRNITENGIGDWTKIDFVAEFSPTLKVTVEKVYEGAAVFGAGVVQYVFTYGNKYGQQSNIVHVSPVYYASPSGRGGSPEESVNCQFRITVSGFDTTWRWLNVYRLMQTSESGQWTADRVARLDVGEGEAVYTDDGSSAESVDPAEMLYVGGREISAYTMCAKDQTLFLGNMRLLTKEADKRINDMLGSHRDTEGYSGLLRFEYTEVSESIPYVDANGLYPYDSQLEYSGDVIRTFKAGEKYRIGLRLVTGTGNRSGVYWIGDVEQTLYPQMKTEYGGGLKDGDGPHVSKAKLVFEIPDDLMAYLADEGYVQAELMMAERTVSDRCVQAQGFVCPTMFNLNHRATGQTFSYSSWYARPRLSNRMVSRHYFPLPKNDDFGSEIQCTFEEPNAYCSSLDEANGVQFIGYTLKYQYKWVIAGFHRAKLELYYGTAGEGAEIEWKESGKKKTTKWRDRHANLVKDVWSQLKKWGFLYYDAKKMLSSIVAGHGSTVYSFDDLASTQQPYNAVYGSLGKDYAYKHKNAFFVDESIFTFHTPELRDECVQSFDNARYNIRIVGYAPVTSNITDYSIEVGNFHSGFSTVPDYELSAQNVSSEPEGLITFPLFNDVEVDCLDLDDKNGYKPKMDGNKYEVDRKQTTMYVYPWHKTGSITDQHEDVDKDGLSGVQGEAQNVLKGKTESNMRFAYDTRYAWTNGSGTWEGGETYPLRVFNSDEETMIQVETTFGKKEYKGNYDILVSCLDASNDDVDEDVESGAVDEGYMLFNTNGMSPYNSVENTYESADDGVGDEDGDDAEGSADVPFGKFRNVVRNSIDAESIIFHDPVDITVKSTPHIVVSLKGEDEGNVYKVRSLPNIVESGGNGIDVVETPEAGESESLFLPWANVSDFDPDEYPDAGQYLLVARSNILKDGVAYYTGSDIDVQKGVATIYDTYEYLSSIEWKDVEDVEDDGETIEVDPCQAVIYLDADDGRYYVLGVKGKPEPFVHQIDSPWDISVVDGGFRREYEGDGETGVEAYYYLLNVTFRVPSCCRNVNLSGADSIESLDIKDGLGSLVAVFRSGNRTAELSIMSNSNDSSWFTDSDYVKFCKVEINDNGVSRSASPELLESGKEGSDYCAALTLTGEIVGQAFLVYEYGISTNTYFYDSSTNVLSNITFKGFEFEIGSLSVPTGTSQPMLFIAELYRDFSVDDSRYGGTTDYAVQNNTFIPLGNVTALDGASELTAYAGDTYFQRWDCQKTRKWSDEAENNINEFVSVMLETYHNIEGRYDVRRGLLNNQATTPENSNLFNGAYDNLGTLFSGNVLDEKYSLDEYPAQLTWTLDKTPGADVDSWMNVTLASVLDMDGSKGPLEALRTHANSIFAFQDRGIAEVLFNTRTQLATTEGVPVEIANSGRVDGKRYVTERNGCRDKWSIGVTKGGLWFADGVNGTINRVAQQVEDVSTRKGMSVWTRARCGAGIWDPVEYGAFAAFADTTRDEVYFCRPMEGERLDAVCFSEVLDEFTSFHGYGALSAMFNVGDRLLAFRGCGDGESGMWLQGEGRHGEFFGEAQDWYVQFRAAPDPYGDKTFTNLEYRADVFDMSEPNPYMEGEGRLTGRTFDSLRVWDEYQGNEVALRFDSLRDAYPDTRRLNRIWRTDIPRARRGEDNPFGLNRIRNPWVWLRLTGTTPEEGDYMMNFHDLTVKYIE